MTRPDPAPGTDGVLPRAALAGGGLAALAVALEVWGSWGVGASAEPPGSWLVASGWPTPLRVTWWLAASVGVYLANRGLARVTHRPRRLATTVAVLPFVAFALGIATGAEWATWH